MISNLKHRFRRQAFDPSIWGTFVNPFYLARRSLARAMRNAAEHVSGRVLDVGCGQKPYIGMFDVSAYVGLEIDTPTNRANKQADYYYDGSRFPFEDAEFDAVLCNQVLEHVFEPDDFLAEIHRVLKPGGTLVLTVPFVWDEHEQPVDYARYSSFGLQHLMSKHGFVMHRQIKTSADISILFQLLNAYMFKVTHTRFRVLNLIFTALLMAPVSLAGLFFGWLLPRNPDLYLDNVSIAKKASRSEGST